MIFGGKGLVDHPSIEDYVDYKTLDDTSLIRLIAHNKQDALGELYDRYGRLVFSVAFNSTSNQAVAEEITQDVFTRVWEKASTYDVDLAKVSTWLISITRNRAIDELRRLRVRPENHSVGWDDLSRENVPQSDGPETLTELIWKQKSVREAIALLPPDQQQSLALAYFKGYSHSEIAAALGEPLGTVKTRIRLALQKLRQVLEEKVVDSG
ncbi:MAG: sigma-70 family RNA polymerase sigma factor [Chloroflexota bacterium]|nr:MAG: sigma-70 family RNA polymerase sigma factor [Chloroflexota bacterium]